MLFSGQVQLSDGLLRDDIFTATSIDNDLADLLFNVAGMEDMLDFGTSKFDPQ